MVGDFEREKGHERVSKLSNSILLERLELPKGKVMLSLTPTLTMRMMIISFAPILYGIPPLLPV